MHSMLKRLLSLGSGVVLLFLIAVTSAWAQSRFEPVLQVGETLITRHQVDERVRFLTLLNAQGDVRALATEQLTVAAIQTDAARAAGVGVDEAELSAALDEFASQANLTGDAFIEALAQNGVGAETFRTFISTSLLWRNYVRARFGDEARDLPDSLIQRTLTRTGTEGGTRVLLSEVILPAGTAATRAASVARARELTTIRDTTAFSAAARRFSVARSRQAGGERSWQALDALPEEVRRAVSGLSIGQVTQPIVGEETISLYFLRDRETIAAGTPESLNVDYALFLTSGGADAAEAIRARVDTCTDFFGLPADGEGARLIRADVASENLPSDIRAAIATLDTFETTTIRRDNQIGVLMLCGRTIDAESEIDFDLVGTRLLNQKLTALAAHHLAELRAETVIRSLTN